MSKYKAIRMEMDWIVFDSKVEYLYYSTHRDLIKKVHPKYELQKKFVNWWENFRSIVYIWDFLIEVWNRKIVVDVKWCPTQAAKIKRKMFLYKYPELELSRLVYVKKRGGRIDYFENEELKRKDKKALNHKK